MLFRQLFNAETCTFTYLLACEETKEAALIDTVYEEVKRDAKLMEELGLTVKYLIETHVHADHITGGREIINNNFPKAVQVYSVHSGVTIEQPNPNLQLVKEGDIISIGTSVKLHVVETPGHTNGCLSFYTDDKLKVFTGDALFIRGCGRTDFQQGSPYTLYNSIKKLYNTLPDECLVYPGHDYKGMTCSSIGEEKKFNPRINENQTAEGFATIMNGLNLPQPKKINIAVPANLLGGVPVDQKLK
ncbi:hypothetical protein ABK040_003238 [Willaertia magna]